MVTLEIAKELCTVECETNRQNLIKQY